MSPARLVLAAREHEVGTLALTDHDTTEGLAAALEAGRTCGVEVVPGVEINTDVGEHEVHVLGYYVDYHREDFQTFLGRRRAERVWRAERMVEKLAALGVPVAWTRVREIAVGAAVGRPHIARALLEAGWVRSSQEAFERFLGRTGPAYVPRGTLTPEDAIAVILHAGGVPVLAHPGWASSGPILDRLAGLVQCGLAGIEVYYPDHTPAMVSAYLGLAHQYGLVATGGTDFHGGGLATRVPLGSVQIPPDVLPALQARREALAPTSVLRESQL